MEKEKTRYELQIVEIPDVKVPATQGGLHFEDLKETVIGFQQLVEKTAQVQEIIVQNKAQGALSINLEDYRYDSSCSDGEAYICTSPINQAPCKENEVVAKKEPSFKGILRFFRNKPKNKPDQGCDANNRSPAKEYECSTQ